MRIRALELASFRLFKEKQVSFASGLNLIAGPNATGKTSVLEAIYLLWAGRSFKTSSLKELIAFQEPFLRVDLTVEKQGVMQKLGVGVSEQEKHFLHNRTCYASFNPLLGILKGVLLEPNDVALIHGPPSLRRRYLDLQLAQTSPLYVHHLLRYNRSLKERNVLLKTKREGAIETYEAIMAQASVYIRQARHEAIGLLEKKLAPYYALLAGVGARVSLEYQPSGGLELNLAKSISELAKQRPRDFRMGATLCGPHRDEMKIHLNGVEARLFASEGEKRSLAAVLRLAEWEHMKEASEETPLFFCDDLGLGLDESRLSALLKILHQMPQSLLTVPLQGPSLEVIHRLKLDFHSVPWVN